MLANIGDSLIDPAEVIVAAPAGEETRLILRGGITLITRKSFDEVREQLIVAGAFADPDSLGLPKLSAEERDELRHLSNLGFGWIARDGDGKIFAYRDFPKRDGAYWMGSVGSGDTVQLSGDFDFVSSDAHEPLAIDDLL